jgi:phage shock protein A
MKSFVLWFMGDSLGGAVINTWDWLWQMPIAETSIPTAKTSDNLTLEHAQRLLSSIEMRVLEMQTAVDKVRNSTQEIQRQYEAKGQQHQELIDLVREYQRAGNTIEARLAMAKAIGIERILPELKARWENSQEMLLSINECHAQEQAKLTLLEIEMETIRACMAMSDSMGGNREIDKINELNHLQERFHDVQTEIEDRYRQIQVMSQLSPPSNCVLEEPLNIQDIDTRIQSLLN